MIRLGKAGVRSQCVLLSSRTPDHRAIEAVIGLKHAAGRKVLLRR